MTRVREAVELLSRGPGSKRVITFKVEVEQEEDGRRLADVVELPGVLEYRKNLQALALRVLAERLEH